MRHRLHVLPQLDPVAVVALADGHAVDDRLEHAAQAEARIRGVQLVDDPAVERPDRRRDLAVADANLERDVVDALATHEELVQRRVHVLEDVVRHVEARAETAEHQVRDSEEFMLARELQRDDVVHARSASRSSSASSCSRSVAAVLPTSTAPRQFRLVLNSATPWLTPAAKPVIFWTGRVMAKLTARTAVSALSAASTALSVI